MESINYYAGRIATIFGVVIALLTALTPIIAETDWTETAGILGGGAAAIIAIREFIVGAREHERNLVDASLPPAPE